MDGEAYSALASEWRLSPGHRALPDDFCRPAIRPERTYRDPTPSRAGGRTGDALLDQHLGEGQGVHQSVALDLATLDVEAPGGTPRGFDAIRPAVSTTGVAVQTNSPLAW